MLSSSCQRASGGEKHFEPTCCSNHTNSGVDAAADTAAASTAAASAAAALIAAVAACAGDAERRLKITQCAIKVMARGLLGGIRRVMETWSQVLLLLLVLAVQRPGEQLNQSTQFATRLRNLMKLQVTVHTVGMTPSVSLSRLQTVYCRGSTVKCCFG